MRFGEPGITFHLMPQSHAYCRWTRTAPRTRWPSASRMCRLASVSASEGEGKGTGGTGRNGSVGRESQSAQGRSGVDAQATRRGSLGGKARGVLSATVFMIV